MKRILIAPCGMNCTICTAYNRDKNTCPGCRELEKKTPPTRINCNVRNCVILKENKWMFCTDKCDKYPCKRLKALDKRYRTKYHMSMLENLDHIKQKGIKSFIEKEDQKWKCPQCGGIVTCHGGKCLDCGYQKYSSPPTKSKK